MGTGVDCEFAALGIVAVRQQFLAAFGDNGSAGLPDVVRRYEMHPASVIAVSVGGISVGDTGDRLAFVVEQPVLSWCARHDAPIPPKDVLIESPGPLDVVCEQIGPDDLAGQVPIGWRIGEWR